MHRHPLRSIWVEDHLPQSVRVERRPVSEHESRSANGPDWDRYADEYQATHGAFLGDAGFVWGPEGHTEDELGILGDVAGLDVLEVGSGAGQCSRWVRTHGGRGFGLDLSHRQLQHSLRLDEETGVAVPSVRGTATALPFAAAQLRRRLLLLRRPAVRQRHRRGGRRGRPGCCAREAGSPSPITHPTRWMFPDDPGEPGLTATQSYWDRTPYVEVDDATGVVAYVEHHRTLGDWVRLLAAHDFRLVDLVEPEWPEQNTTGCGAAGHVPAGC